MHYIGIGTGFSYSTVLPNDKRISNSLLKERYFISYERYLDNRDMTFTSPKYSIELGICYESKNYNILNLNNQSIQLESNYLTIPIKYQYEFIDLQKSITVSVVLGSFYSLLLNEKSSDKNIEYLPNSNYGIIVGPKIEVFLINGYFLNLDYNFQYGFASLNNSISNTNNVGHIINIGFKAPSTIF